MTYTPRLFQLPADDAPDVTPYVFNDEILVALDVALATGRPLLVAGPPGSGKTSLARKAAQMLGWGLLPHTVTSRTRLEDLQAEIDHLRRLADAQLARDKTLPPDWTYLRPGVLWWAFDPQGASRRGASEIEQAAAGAGALAWPQGADASGVVLLLDEIDKADPDLPNDLLEPLDRRSFGLPLHDRPAVQAHKDRKVLTVLTTNGERDLPPAFLRRCVVLKLNDPRARADREGIITLEDIAERHFPDADETFKAQFSMVANTVSALRRTAVQRGARPPSAAEYLDTLRALQALPQLLSSGVWTQVEGLLLDKNPGRR